MKVSVSHLHGYAIKYREEPLTISESRLAEAPDAWLDALSSLEEFYSNGAGVVDIPGEEYEMDFELFLMTGPLAGPLVDAMDLYEGRLPPGMLPLGNDTSGNLLSICTSGPDYGKVYFWEHDADWPEDDPSGLVLVAESFTDLIRMLRVQTEEKRSASDGIASDHRNWIDPSILPKRK